VDVVIFKEISMIFFIVITLFLKMIHFCALWNKICIVLNVK